MEDLGSLNLCLSLASAMELGSDTCEMHLDRHYSNCGAKRSISRTSGAFRVFYKERNIHPTANINHRGNREGNTTKQDQLHPERQRTMDRPCFFTCASRVARLVACTVVEDHDRWPHPPELSGLRHVKSTSSAKLSVSTSCATPCSGVSETIALR
jgi:hypothetical protein